MINHSAIENLPADACVEIPCLVDGNGITPCQIGRLPVALAAMLDPHTAAELSIDDIVKMCDEMIDAHGDFMKMYH